MTESIASPTNNQPWLDEQIAALCTLAAKGYSAGRIAKNLADQFGVARSRGAVIGKLNRLGLLNRPKPVQSKLTKHPTPAKHSGYPVGEPPPGSVPLQVLTSSRCRFPFGDRAPFRFCGVEVIGGSSWCKVHHEVVFRPRLVSKS
jgi:hypothetical protein